MYEIIYKRKQKVFYCACVKMYNIWSSKTKKKYSNFCISWCIMMSSQKSINRTTCSRGGCEGEDWSNIKRTNTCFCLEITYCYKPSKSLQTHKYSAIQSSSIPGYKPQVLWWWTAGRKVLQHSYWINSLTFKRVRLRDPRVALRQEEQTVRCPQLVGRKLRVIWRSDWK